ncbi:MAG: hypothetical protein PHG85_07280 [Candidatus Altiarchaeota archaeon]|nr:hypothetical protein [Candidatus Altiarchaeota archaeon]
MVKGKRKWTVLIAAAFVMTAIAFGLFVLKGPGGGEALELQERSLAAIRNVSTYSYLTRIDARSTGLSGEGIVNVSTRMAGNGTIDVRQNLMHAYVGIRINGISGEDSINTQNLMEMYVVKDTVYTRTGKSWVKGVMESDAWENTQLIEEANAIMDGSAVITGTEEIDGESAYVLAITPSSGSSSAYSAGLGSETGGIESELLENRIFEWISKETLLPLRISNEQVFSAGNITTKMTVISDYYDFNAPVEIQLPDDAAGALSSGSL